MAPTRPTRRAAFVLTLALAALATGCPAPSTPTDTKASSAPRRKPSPSPSASASPSAFPTLAPSEGSAPVVVPTAATSLAPTSAPASAAPTATPEPTPPPGRIWASALPTVGTLAGAEAGLADGAAAVARFDSPNGVDFGPDGHLYVADAGNHRIRRLQANGETITFAGAGEGFLDGAPGEARFKAPYGVAVTADAVYVADTGNHRIRKITAAEGVTTVAGDGTPGLTNGPAAGARFKSPFSVVAAPNGDLYVADSGNHCIRKISAAGEVTTFAGGEAGNVDGPFASARFQVPNDLALDGEAGIFVVDGINHNVRYVDFALSIVRTLAGSGQAGHVDQRGARAKLNAPSGLSTYQGGALVADTLNHAVRFVTKDGDVTTLVGGGGEGTTDGAAGVARLNAPTDLAVGADGTIYVTDTKADRIRTLK